MPSLRDDIDQVQWTAILLHADDRLKFLAPDTECMTLMKIETPQPSMSTIRIRQLSRLIDRRLSALRTLLIHRLTQNWKWSILLIKQQALYRATSEEKVDQHCRMMKRDAEALELMEPLPVTFAQRLLLK